MKTIFNKMKFGRVLSMLAVLAIATLLLIGTTGCGEGDEGSERLKVAADIMPLADFCNNVGRELVEVEMLIPAGASPHNYELTSEQMKFLSGADMLVLNGLDLTPWAEDIFDKVDNPDMVRVRAAEAVPAPDLIEASDGAYDPHVWLDPELAVHQVEAIRDGFVEADPDNGEIYRENADACIDELRGLSEYIGGEVSTFTRRKFVSFHPAWSYFARRYGLEQVGVVEELPGKEPGVGEIADLVELIRAEGVEVIFTEPQFNPKAAEVIAEESGADVVLKSLDPLGDPDDEEKDTYVKFMKNDVGIMAEAMR
ncbi:MAG: metal ABC transporter substrate-binding protein [Actinomycetota bacterium]|nr:metal ABC transporter substrate-binding protein [Actinomycetota bacterium]